MARMMGVMGIKVTPETEWSTPPSQRLFLCLESEKGTETEFTDLCKMFKTMGAFNTTLHKRAELC